MRFLDFVVFILLFALFGTGLYLLWLNLPSESTEFEVFVANFSDELPQESAQFHKNMRYAEKRIGYFVSQNCSLKKQSDFSDAVELLERNTVLDFYASEEPDLLVTCENIEPKANEEGHFVAGEGGPSVIVNASRFAVISLGRIALFRPETCDTPQVATHEILHALGFDHNSNPESIMFPVTNCGQTLDSAIVNEINRLYSIPPAGDLVLESVRANTTGRYLNFEAVMANYGLREIGKSKLQIFVEGDLVKEFDTESLRVGAKKTLTISNLRIPRNAESIVASIETSEQEILTSNNMAEISVVGS